MNEQNIVPENIFIDVIYKGKPLDQVLEAFQTAFEHAKAVSSNTADKAFADAMTDAVYMVYLIGVMDGMKEDK